MLKTAACSSCQALIAARCCRIMWSISGPAARPPTAWAACPLPVGGATAHHPLTLHYTGPNQSDGYRRAWIVHFAAYGFFRFRLHPKCVAKRLRALVSAS